MKAAKKAKVEKGTGKRRARELVRDAVKAAIKGGVVEKSLRRITEGNTGWYRLFESFSGAWQRNVTVDRDSVLTYFATFACMTLIAADISKLGFRLVKETSENVWERAELENVAPVLRKPNPFQTRIQFFESYILSKLATGNVYVLKQRNALGYVVRLYILDPRRVAPMVSPDGTVFYELAADNVAGLNASIMVPATEIIHDRFNTIFHPLIGMSPLEAAGIAAMQGLAIQNASAGFFANNSRPGGILTAPGEISQDNVDRLKTDFQEKFSGENSGKVAVLGDGLKFEPMTATAVESQMLEQGQWSASVVCSVFHVPGYKIGMGDVPKYDSIQALNVEYYTQALQSLIEAAELCMDEGLGLLEPIDGVQYGTEFDIDGLLRMDTAALFKSLGEGVKGSILKPNEARRRAGYGPADGGDSVLAQQQNYSLAALAKRDSGPDPFKTAPAPAPEPPKEETEPPKDDEGKAIIAAIAKGFEEAMQT